MVRELAHHRLLWRPESYLFLFYFLPTKDESKSHLVDWRASRKGKRAGRQTTLPAAVQSSPTHNSFVRSLYFIAA